MYEVQQQEGGVGFKLSSDVVLVDRVVRDCETFLQAHSGGEILPIKSVIRELLINAIEHGNRNQAGLTVTCELSQLGDDRFKVTVGDEGQGFDHKSLSLSLPQDPLQERNRGFALVNNIADQIEFNEAGNVVTAYVSARKETGYSVEQAGDWHVITPTGDITAASVNKLRLLLLELLEKGHTKYRYDLRNVEDIDSVSISVLILFSKSLSGKVAEPCLEIAHARKELVSLFRLTRLDRIFHIVETPQG